MPISNPSNSCFKMAASNTARIIDLETDQSEAQANLQFQDFTDSEIGGTGAVPQQVFTGFSGDAMNDDDEESEELLNREKKPPSFWEFSYYQSLFDVTTKEVLDRVLWSALPRLGSGSTYLENHIKPNPDLYGPVWVGVTLIVTTSVSSNVANYLESVGETKHFWHTDYTRVSFASSAILLYIFLVPLILWAGLKYRSIETRFTLIETLCLYGYSLSIYVPISILWAVHLTWLRWTLMIFGALMSGIVLISSLWPSLRGETRKMAVITISLVLLMHALLALGFVVYFFHEAHVDPTSPSVSSPSAPAVVPSSVPSNLSHVVTRMSIVNGTNFTSSTNSTHRI
ncbi:protein YIPF1-like isoform X2 [Ornithodoros turicata]|uniref:protein YIPF1-like isoform X2 n=1 Tax=Ornithodoros turicata TaxID=34597 RepID=UPI003138DCAC